MTMTMTSNDWHRRDSQNTLGACHEEVGWTGDESPQQDPKETLRRVASDKASQLKKTVAWAFSEDTNKDGYCMTGMQPNSMKSEFELKLKEKNGERFAS